MMIFKSSIKLFSFVLLMHILLSVNIHAYELKNVRFKVKTHQLPKFCLCAGYPPPDCSSKDMKAIYAKFYGPIFYHLHHYCWGLDKLNKQLRSSNPRLSQLKYVISEFDYVLRHKDPKRSIKAEIFTKKAQVLLIMHKNVEAIKSFYNAIRFNKKYIPAYIYLSDFLLKSGDRTGACKILKLGMSYNPHSKAIKNRKSFICQ